VWCRKGGVLAVTDANVLLGRVIPDFFPHIFGPHENEPLDRVAVQHEFERLTKEVRKQSVSQSVSQCWC
jgi:5-oxoprolinase (ATP-hydrolysing)